MSKRWRDHDLSQELRVISDILDSHPEEKVVSIFEPHTDIFVKRDRETLFGYKVILKAGKSSMILDCIFRL